MSRFQHKINVINTTTGKNKVFDVAYGFDEMLSEYYIQVSYVDDDGNDSFLIDKATYTTGTDKSSMLMLYILFGVPEEHKTFLALDLKF